MKFEHIILMPWVSNLAKGKGLKKASPAQRIVLATIRHHGKPLGYGWFRIKVGDITAVTDICGQTIGNAIKFWKDCGYITDIREGKFYAKEFCLHKQLL